MNIIQPLYTNENLREELDGITHDDLDNVLRNFTHGDLSHIVVPVLDAVIDGVQVHKYEGQAISRFEAANGDIIIGTPDGHVNITEMVAELRNLV